MPLIQGSTTVSAIAVATAASTALPPADRISAPASAAMRLCEATRPRRERVSGLAIRQFSMVCIFAGASGGGT
jgi:hypothetical protein